MFDVNASLPQSFEQKSLKYLENYSTAICQNGNRHLFKKSTKETAFEEGTFLTKNFDFLF